MGNRLRNFDHITMDTIAKELSVSKATVSRVVSGKGRIGQETRDKILDYIESCGYKPNNFARALAGSKTCNIGVVIPDSSERGEAEFFKDCLVGIIEASTKRDYDAILTFVTKGNYGNLERLVKNRKVDGVVLTHNDSKNKMVSYLQKNEMPFILIGQNKNNILQIDSNQKEGCCALTAKLLEENPEGVAFMAGSPELDVEKIRYEGYSQAFELAGRTVDKDLVFWNSEISIEISLDKILSCGVKCIVCSDDLICMSVMHFLKESNVKVPEQMKVASFFDSEKLEHNEVPVTSLHIDTKQLSQKAGELLIDFLEGKEIQNRNVAECSVVYRNSSR